MIPDHIKLHVSRIVQEYEVLYRKGHKVALHFFINNKLYSGTETTAFFLSKAIDFRKTLDTQDSVLFSGTEEVVHQKIYQEICELYKNLPAESIRKVNRTSESQYQLKEALYRATKTPSLLADAHQLKTFIANRELNWAEEDASVEHRIFKLVSTPDSFEKLLLPNKNGKSRAVEITHSDSNFHYSHFRIALQIISIEEIYRKQHRVCEYRRHLNTLKNVDTFDMDCRIFNLWNDVKETGIYYVYIPQY